MTMTDDAILSRGMIVRRDDFHATRSDEQILRPQEGQAVLQLDHFALTANNVTYIAVGDDMGYWQFFPAPEGWGRVPVWGFGDVVASRCPDLPVGERVYGYFPMSTHLMVTPAPVEADQFVDSAPHRAHLPPVYNIYRRRAAAPRQEEYLHELLSPLYTTSFLVGDFLQDNGWFGAERLVIASASSKTALGLGYYLSSHEDRPAEVVALTSARSVSFLEQTGYFDRVVGYDDLDSLPADTATVYTDFSGDVALRTRVHGHFTGLAYDCLVGGTHWEELTGEANGSAFFSLTGDGPETGTRIPTSFFFAPTQMDKRFADWGEDVFYDRLGQSWVGFSASALGWLRFIEVRGADAATADYIRVLDGHVSADEGHILSMND